MPPKAAGGVRNFVHQRNEVSENTRAKNASGGNGDYDDLKVPVPAVPNSNIKQKMTATKGTQGTARPLTTDHSQNEQKPFYGTDTSGISETSTTMSVQVANRGAERVKPVQQTASRQDDDDRGSLASDEEYETDVSEEDRELPKDPFQNPTQAVRSGRGGKPDGSGFPYIKGDSYPTTTDGVPSVSDAVERRRAQDAHQTMPPPALAQAHESGRRSGVHHSNGGRPQNQAQRRPSPEKQPEAHAHKQGGLFQNPASLQPPVEEVLGAGFAFGKAVPNNMAIRPQNQRPHSSAPARMPATVHPPAASGPASTNAAQAGSAEWVDKHHAQHQAVNTPALANNTTMAPRQQHSEKPKARRKSRPAMPAEQPVAEPEPQYQQAVDIQQKLEEGLPSAFRSQQEQPNEAPMQLDVDLPALYETKYEDLKAANFDHDPKADDFSMPNGPLDDNLCTASAMTAADQARFFATLDIGQWEEAGEWFLGRFGNIVSKLKAARQEKRKAARIFEDEVEKRHGAVSKKRKLTEDALGEMKANGALVLQGTPKKVKKTK